MGIGDAGHAENGLPSEHFVVTPVACPVPGRAAGAPALSGASRVRVQPDSLLYRCCGRQELDEEYFCNYEVNRDYAERFEAAGLRVSARGPDGEIRAVELPGNRFFLATLFQPQLSSREDRPHPVIVSYLEAACATRERIPRRASARS